MKTLIDDAQRRRILEEDGKTFMVEAAAGTGKTTSLISRMLLLLARGRCTTETLAAVTFTKKASAELRHRFRLKLEMERDTPTSFTTDTEQTNLAQALANIDRLFIGTIHSFCAALLRERPVQAGVDIGFQEIDATEDAALRTEVWRSFTAQLHQSKDPLPDRLNALGVQLAELKDAFSKFADYPDVRIQSFAQAAPPDHTAAQKAQIELTQAVANWVSPCGTSGATDKTQALFSDIQRLLRHLDATNPLELSDFLKAADKIKKGQEPPHDALPEWERFRAFCDEHAEPLVIKWRENRYPLVLETLRRAEDEYQKLKQRRGQLNFQDLLMQAAKLLKSSPAVRAHFKDRFKCVLVDEFQDTDPIQAEVLLLLTATNPAETDWRKCTPEPGSLFVVGDPKQSIYRFRRADMVTYNQVKEIIEKDPQGEILQLRSGFRTVPSVVKWINDVFTPVIIADGNKSPEYVALDAVKDPAPPMALSGVSYVQRAGTGDVKKEAQEIGRHIQAALNENGVAVGDDTHTQLQPGEFMIITHTSANLGAFGAVFQDLEIPHQVTGGAGLNLSKELRLLYLCAAAAGRPYDQTALVAVLRSPVFGFSDLSFYNYKIAGGSFCFLSELPEALHATEKALFMGAYARIAKWAHWLRSYSPVVALEKIIEDVGLYCLIAGHAGRIMEAGALARAVELVRSAQSGSLYAADAVELLSVLADPKSEAEHDSLPVRPYDIEPLRIMNLHKAKGLEARVVFLADPSSPREHPINLHVDRSDVNAAAPQGYLRIRNGPHEHSEVVAQPVNWNNYEEEEKRFQKCEEDRLHYVAATRAGEGLIVSRQAPKKGGSTNATMPRWSFFSDHINTSLARPSECNPPIALAPPVALAPDAVQNAAAATESRRATLTEKTYDTASAKMLSVQRVKFTSEGGSYAAQWGTVIHALLECAMIDPKADLHNQGLALLGQNDLEQLIDQALETVKTVRNENFWQRAQNAEKRFVEIPFQILDRNQANLEVMTRGIIDLLFKEKKGWVLVDYKSDRIPPQAIQERTDLYTPQLRAYKTAWKRMTGEDVVETALYFTHLKRYHVFDC